MFFPASSVEMSRLAQLHVVWFAGGVLLGITSVLLLPGKPKEPEDITTCANVPISCGDFDVVSGDVKNPPRTCNLLRIYCLDICSYMSLECKWARHQFGMTYKQPKGMMGVSHADLMFLDFISSLYPELANFTELGTAAGTLLFFQEVCSNSTGITSFYFGVTARLRRGDVHTYDLNDTRNPLAAEAWLDNMHFFREDILTKENQRVVASLKRSPQIAFFDNGNKIKEVNTYIRYLPVGSVMVTHDWNIEIWWKDIEAEINARGFEKLHEAFAEKLGSNVRAFIRNSEGLVSY